MTHPQRPLKKAQTCPLCSTPLPAGALFCETCGTDLSRASVVLSAYVRPVSRSRFGGARVARLVGLSAGVLAALALVLAGLGSIPQVSARMPAIARLAEPIRDAFSQVVSWGSGGAQPQPAPVAAPVPPPVASTPPPPPAPAPSTPYLIVRSTPAGAEVFMDKERVGKTPLTLKQLRPGSYVIRVVRKGYTATSRTIELKPNIGVTVSLALKPVARPAAKPVARPQSVPASRPQAKPAAQPAMPIGTPAPAFSLKDRRGVIYRLSDFRGHNVAVLFIWELDQRGTAAARAFAARTAGQQAVIVLLRPNRVAVRRFLNAENISTPILLGHPGLAAQYRVPEGAAVIFLINDQGRIQHRQVAAQS